MIFSRIDITATLKHTRFIPFATLLTCLFLAGCTTPPDDEQIAENIHQLASAVEDRNTGDVFGFFSEAFHIDHSGHDVSRDALRKMVTAVFLRHKVISVVITNVRVERDEFRSDVARARFNALVTGGHGGILPQRAELYRLDTRWEQSGGDWLLASATARRALEPD